MREHSSFEPDGLVYAREKLGVAVWKLATGIGTIKARLADAYIELAFIQESDLPPEFVDEWEKIKFDLTNGKMIKEIHIVDGEFVEGPIGFLHSTLRYMRNNKAQDLAKRICLLESKLEHYLPSE